MQIFATADVGARLQTVALHRAGPLSAERWSRNKLFLLGYFRPFRIAGLRSEPGRVQWQVTGAGQRPAFF